MGWRCIFREGGGRGEVRDARGQRFLVVEMDLGYSGCVEGGACVWEESFEGGGEVGGGGVVERWKGAVVMRDEEDVDE